MTFLAIDTVEQTRLQECGGRRPQRSSERVRQTVAPARDSLEQAVAPASRRRATVIVAADFVTLRTRSDWPRAGSAHYCFAQQSGAPGVARARRHRPQVAVCLL